MILARRATREGKFDRIREAVKYKAEIILGPKRQGKNYTAPKTGKEK